jgi:hypothetical protein
MTMREVKLVDGAREKALEFGVPVGVLQDEATYSREVNDGWVTVRGRDFALLRVHGLVDENATRLVEPAADQPEAEAAADTSRTHAKSKKDRGPSGTDRSVLPGGTGHQEGDAYSNVRINPTPPAKAKTKAKPEAKAKPESESEAKPESESKSPAKVQAQAKSKE